MISSPRRQVDPLLAGAGLHWATLPWLALLVLVATWPLALAIGHADFQQVDASDGWRVARLFLNSSAVIAISIAFALPVGVCLGASLFRSLSRPRRIGRLVLCVLAFQPLVLAVGGWLALCGPDGPLHFGKGNLQASGWAIVIVAAIHASWAIPWVALIVGSSLRHVDPDLEDAARLEAPPGRVFRIVTLGQARPALVFAAIVIASSVLVDMTVTDLFQVRTFAEEVYTRFEAAGDEPMATLVSLPLSLLTAVCLAHAAGHWVLAPRSEIRSTLASPHFGSSRSFTWFAAATLGLLALPTFGSFWQLGLEGATAPGAGLRWSGETAARFLARELSRGVAPLIQTIGLAMLASAAGVWVALLLAWQWRWRPPQSQRLAMSLFAWLYLMPGPVLGLTLIDLCNRPSPLDLLGRIYDSPAIVVVGQAIRVIPPAWLLICVFLSMLDRSEFEAAALEGAAGWTICVKVAAPRLVGPLLVAFLAGTALAMSELPVTKFVAPPGLDLLAPRIFHLLHSGMQNQQAALAFLLEATILIFVVPTYLAARLIEHASRP